MDSLIRSLENVFRTAWDNPAITEWGSDVTYKYGDIAKRIVYIHLLFEELGIKPGDKVAVCDKNSANWMISTLAIITYKAVAVPLLADYSDKQIVMLCEHCDAKFMICNRKMADLWPEGNCPMYLLDIADLLTMNPSSVTDEVEERVFAQFSKRFPQGYTKDDVCYEAENPDDLMLLSYTSGSTGNPKGVMLSYRSICSNLDYVKKAIPICENENMLLVLPMAHIFGLTCDFLHGMMSKAYLHVLTKTPAPTVLMKALQTIRPSVFLCVPLIMEKIVLGKIAPKLNEPKVSKMSQIPILRQFIYGKVRKEMLNFFGNNVRRIVMGGAALNKDVEKILHKVKFPYFVGYGMTECGPLIAYSYNRKKRYGSCGNVVSRMEVSVLSEDPQHVPGEIVVRGDNVMMGYYKNPDASEETIDKDGWMHTGDLGVLDKDGYLYIRGRKKNMLLSSNGQNIFPEEAEAQVVAHSLFDECVVVQRDGKLVALVYVNDVTLRAMQTTREAVEKQLDVICKEINTYLPKYCQLSKMVQRTEEFEKTPKKSIRRFLYS